MNKLYARGVAISQAGMWTPDAAPVGNNGIAREVRYNGPEERQRLLGFLPF